ncbi:MAG: sulfatase-like hydrolase/transferase, partial [Cellulosilyticaceae bacterium]
MKRKPNILILMSDEHRFDVSGFAGNKIVRTPFLDRLAEDGIVFENAYTPSPVCIPARQCIAVGQLPRTCKVENFGEDLPPNAQTFAKVFAQNGYRTAAAGKLHHLGIDQMQGWLYRIAGDCEVALKHYIADEKDSDKKSESTKSMLTKGIKWDDRKEILRAAPGDSSYARRDKLAIEGTKNFIFEHFVDSYYDRAVPDMPLMLYVGLLNPHYPYIAEEKLFNYYLNRVELYENIEPFNHPFLGKCSNCGPLIPGENIPIRDVKRAVAAYYANVETIDRQFEEVVKALEDAGQDLDEWIVIYTTDHGEMLGEHGIWEKQRFFEGSVKVPLIIRYPKKYEQRVVRKNVNLVDLFATLCELTETEIPQGLDSRSLVPLLEGEEKEWIDETISQWGGKNLMIKWGSIKYQLYTEDNSEVLFDLDVDPDEKNNLIQEVRY